MVGLYNRDKLALHFHANICVCKLIFLIWLSGKQTCTALQKCNRKSPVKVLIKHSGIGWEHMFICTTNSSWYPCTVASLSFFFLFTFLLMLQKYFLKCGYRNTTGIQTGALNPCSTNSQEQSAQGKAASPALTWARSIINVMSSFLRLSFDPEQIDRTPHKCSVS